jgi:hypothetical protein
VWCGVSETEIKGSSRPHLSQCSWAKGNISLGSQNLIAPEVVACMHASIYTYIHKHTHIHTYIHTYILSLAPQPSLGLGLLHKIRLNFLEASQQFSFLQGRVVSPTPNSHPGGPGLCTYSPQRQGGPVIPPRHRVPILVVS